MATMVEKGNEDPLRTISPLRGEGIRIILKQIAFDEEMYG